VLVNEGHGDAQVLGLALTDGRNIAEANKVYMRLTDRQTDGRTDGKEEESREKV
jgi:hypothetical protein